MSNSVDPDETAHYEPSHLDLHCLKKLITNTCGSERVTVPVVSANCSNAVPALRSLVITTWRCVLSVFGYHFFLFRSLGKAVFRNSGIAWVP